MNNDINCDNQNCDNIAKNEKGYIQVYTGNGKGKTTASLGLAMRALGWGFKVLIIMFAKGGDKYGELFSFSKLDKTVKNNLKIVQAGLDRIVYRKNISIKDRQAVQEGWKIAKQAINQNEYDLVILDEANIAIDLDLIDLSEMLNVLKNKPINMEIVLTGRNAKKEITELADLVSEMKPIRHYWDKDVKARKGIEY